MSDGLVYRVDSVVQNDDGSVSATWQLEGTPTWVTSEFASLEEAPAWVRGAVKTVRRKR